jgi:tRNA wybutosine-synthesizing protein 3
VDFLTNSKILHIQTASIDDANRLLRAAFDAGFRESGAMTLSEHPMIAVRSVGLAFDSIIGYLDASGEAVSIVDEPYLQLLHGVANDRFKTNSERINRFREALIPPNPDVKSDWEDASARKERKRREGLALRDRLRAEAGGSAQESKPEEVVAELT